MAFRVTIDGMNSDEDILDARKQIAEAKRRINNNQKNKGGRELCDQFGIAADLIIGNSRQGRIAKIGKPSIPGTSLVWPREERTVGDFTKDLHYKYFGTEGGGISQSPFMAMPKIGQENGFEFEPKRLIQHIVLKIHVRIDQIFSGDYQEDLLSPIGEVLSMAKENDLRLIVASRSREVLEQIIESPLKPDLQTNQLVYSEAWDMAGGLRHRLNEGIIYPYVDEVSVRINPSAENNRRIASSVQPKKVNVLGAVDKGELNSLRFTRISKKNLAGCVVNGPLTNFYG